MVFSSLVFLFRFLPLFFMLYLIVPERMRNLILFFGSLIFYAWGEPVYVILMIISTVSDYLHGLAIASCRSGKLSQTSHSSQKAKGFLISSLCVNLLMLGFFKYADFVIAVLNNVTYMSHLTFGMPLWQIPALNLPLPIGISFYTFQTMSYTIDVYRGKAKVQKDLLAFGVFVTMFPQLIAGPIVKYTDVEPHLRHRSLHVETCAYGIRRFVIGLGKKVLLANPMGMLWADISGKNFAMAGAGSVGPTEELTVLMAWMGIIACALQIYFDFSGYSDMAIGLGAILGFHFPENFRYPYVAKSITEFWRRWHISLSSWFREYVYIPLGGNRKGLGKQIRNLLIVWALTGIWHGAGWNFLLWGLWFAAFLILEKILTDRMQRIKGMMTGRTRRFMDVFGWIYAMTIVLIGWVFFSLDSVESIMGYLGVLFGWRGHTWCSAQTLYLMRENSLLFFLAFIGATPLVAEAAKGLKKKTTYLYILCDKVILAVMLLLSVAYIVGGSFNPFLYFRF